MFTTHLFGRSPIAEIIKSERFASHSLRTLQWIGMPVIREVRRPKYHHPIEYWEYLRLTPAHFAVPKLQVAPIFLVPIFVQIQEQIKPAVEPIIAMLVEISMHRKFTSGHYLMKSAAFEVRV